MDFFSKITTKLEVGDFQNNRISPQILAAPKKGIWKKDNEWTCFKRNQFQICVQIKIPITPIYLESSRIIKFKIEVTCSGVLDSKKVHILQRSTDGAGIVQPVYFPITTSSTTTISKLQFSRSTPSNKSRNLSDPYFQVIVKVSVVTLNDLEYELATVTSENLSVLSGTPAQYVAEREPKPKYSPNRTNSDHYILGFSYASPCNALQNGFGNFLGADDWHQLGKVNDHIQSARSFSSSDGDYTNQLQENQDIKLLSSSNINQYSTVYNQYSTVYNQYCTAYFSNDPVDNMVYNFLMGLK
ncbi:hypothetical protein HDV06_001662 [Boothiomyces sp. JEL0866]|nr:hypothetical protein HDV06_001662 [Boothiomyces sp. JEL0866]